MFALSFLLGEHDIIDPSLRGDAAGDSSGDDLNRAEWTPQTLLGTGGYGRVGLWTKRSFAYPDKILDEMVIKQQQLEAYDEINQHNISLHGDYAAVGVHWEAIIMEGLQGKERAALKAELEARPLQQGAGCDDGTTRFYSDRDEHILRIRQYKWNKTQRDCRLYLEYAPHGSLADLVQDYRVWGLDFPVVFL